MKEQCFDEGTIQSFLDGELASDLLENVARHVAICDDCALLLKEAEEESVFAFNFLDEEFNTLVPTERIRTNLYQAISQLEQPKISLWQRILGFKFSLSNPSLVAFASLLVVVGIFAVVLSFNKTTITTTDLADNTPKIETPVKPVSGDTAQQVSLPLNGSNETLPDKTPSRIEKLVYKPEIKAQKPKLNIKTENPKSEVKAVLLEGEDTYLKTIATLENTVNSKKDNVLRASSRVSYERDMAVIDNSIKRMKAEVSKNPKNEAAKQILRNSYQNKIELLNSVTERSELMARLD